MKKLKRVFIFILSIVILSFLFDLYILRSYFSPSLLENLNDKTELREPTSKGITLNIKKENDSYIFTFNNKTIKPYLVWTYRYNCIFFNVNDSIFQNHYRLKINSPKYTNEYEYGLDCGTGAGHFSINPFESFTSKISYKELLKQFYWGAYHQYNNRNDTIMDLLYNKPLVFVNGRQNTFKVFKRDDIKNGDSINAQFYLPIFSYDYRNIMHVKSNNINLAYKDIVEILIEENQSVFTKIIEYY